MEPNNKKTDDEYSTIFRDQEPKPKNDMSHMYDGMSRKKKPKCCEACGGPYPMCKDGCSLFDD